MKDTSQSDTATAKTTSSQKSRSEPKKNDTMWEIDRMLLRQEIDLDDHKTLEQFIHDIHNIRLFSLPPQTFEVKSYTGIPMSGTSREAFAWKKLSEIRTRFKRESLELDSMMMDLGLDEATDYDMAVVKKGVEILNKFYGEW